MQIKLSVDGKNIVVEPKDVYQVQALNMRCVRKDGSFLKWRKVGRVMLVDGKRYDCSYYWLAEVKAALLSDGLELEAGRKGTVVEHKTYKGKSYLNGIRKATNWTWRVKGKELDAKKEDSDAGSYTAIKLDGHKKTIEYQTEAASNTLYWRLQQLEAKVKEAILNHKERGYISGSDLVEYAARVHETAEEMRTLSRLEMQRASIAGEDKEVPAKKAHI